MVVVWYACDVTDVVGLWCGTVVVWYGCGVADLKKNIYKRTMFGSMKVDRSSKDQSQSM